MKGIDGKLCAESSILQKINQWLIMLFANAEAHSRAMMPESKDDSTVDAVQCA